VSPAWRTAPERAARIAALGVSIAKNRLGAVPRPGWCTYLVTYRCNARCGMCDSWRMKPGAELLPAAVDSVFAKIGPLDVVRLTGGEPFLREDLGEIAEAVLRRSRPRVLHVTTNGSLTDRVIDFVTRFSAPRRLVFLVSFDGHRDEHDASRGPKVTYDIAMSTVRRLAALRRPLGIDVSVNHTVISQQSLEDADRLHADLAPLGVEVQSVLAYAESSMYGLKLRGRRAEHLVVPSGYPLHPRLHGADVTGFVEREIERIAKSRSVLLRIGKLYYLRGLLARLRHDSSAAYRPPCVALRSHVRLLPDGRVPVCQFNTETVGDLNADSFDAVWRGPRAVEARAWVDACPGCWAECEVMPSAIYSGDLLRRGALSALSAARPKGADSNAPSAARPKGADSNAPSTARPNRADSNEPRRPAAKLESD
jgi:MoaA/NifB/PqqE/SkfB family radical SAM enzyme